MTLQKLLMVDSNNYHPIGSIFPHQAVCLEEEKDDYSLDGNNSYQYIVLPLTDIPLFQEVIERFSNSQVDPDCR